MLKDFYLMLHQTFIFALVYTLKETKQKNNLNIIWFNLNLTYVFKYLVVVNVNTKT